MLTLPSEIRLACPDCGSPFSLPARSLSERIEVSCPLCRRAFFWFDGLSAVLKREVQQEVEEAVRGLVGVLEGSLFHGQLRLDEKTLSECLRRIISESD